ncbi:MAG TPA: VTC domain-containing protein [Chthoniobacteraceae bacterium]|nr:VTC domain-containing protein [Chthoniobacteraceae bacterium]
MHGELDIMTPGKPAREHELKFPLPAARVPLVEQWLRTFCRPHPGFADTLISSIYYDTDDWRFLNEKVDSDYLKGKVRLRWYHSRRGSAPVHAYIEAKLKEGGQRFKHRYETSLTAEEVDRLPLDSPRYREVLRCLEEQGLRGVSRLSPAYQITYRRLRFGHSFTPSIFCLDHAIEVPRVNHGRFRQVRAGYYPSAVFEQKGPLEELDPVVRGVRHFRLEKRSFSKYMAAYFWLTEAV